MTVVRVLLSSLLKILVIRRIVEGNQLTEMHAQHPQE